MIKAMNTPLRGLIITCSIALAICLIGAAVLEVRKRDNLALAQQQSEIAAAEADRHDILLGARWLMRIASELKTAKTPGDILAQRRELQKWLECTPHPLRRDAARLDAQASSALFMAEHNLGAPEQIRDVNALAADVFQIAVNFKP